MANPTRPDEPRCSHNVSALPARISVWGNVISVIGFLCVAFGGVLLITFFAFHFLSPPQNPYLDILGYMILPGIFGFGLVLVPLGAVIKHWRLRRRPGEYAGTLRLPKFDFNDPKTRRRVFGFLAISIFVVFPLVSVSGYEAYHYSESTEFCGKVCHTVMEPQAVAHSHSPHARVTCAECHIGSGADWFVKSKLSGVRQVFAVLQDTYPRPVPPAISELRPARDTCEDCHWPKKFFGSQYREFVRFSPDEENTRRVSRMLLHTGGADETIGRVEGIHMHMLQNGKIEYVATDHNLQEIPWVRYVKPSGEELIYRSDGEAHDGPVPEGVRRTVDCMDCHNRGAHHIRSPQKAVDLYLEVDRIAASLPYIKREAVEVLTVKYPDKETALQRIRDQLTTFYQENYPERWQQDREDVARSIDGVARIYELNFFPKMNVKWDVYPENIGHLESPGCFRCHDGNHVNQHGEVITTDCEVCHTILVPTEGDPDALKPGKFVHSMMLVQHETLRCDECHNGGRLRLCRDCHASGDWLELTDRMP